MNFTSKQKPLFGDTVSPLPAAGVADAKETVMIGETIIWGKISAIDLTKQTLTVQPRISFWPGVTVNFKKTQQAQVVENLDRDVAVSGLGHFTLNAAQPYLLEMTALRTLTLPTTGPTKLSEMYGYFVKD